MSTLELIEEFEKTEEAPQSLASAAKENCVPMAVRKSFIWSYRLMAVCTLYGVLLGFVGYVFLLGFYALDSSWIAPLIISPSDNKSLDLTIKIMQTAAAAQALELDLKKLQASVPEYHHHRDQLLALEPQLASALKRENTQNPVTGQELVGLNRQKNLDNIKMGRVMEQAGEVEEEIDHDLAAGLITKGDAAIRKMALIQAQSTFTDSKIAQVELNDLIVQKNTVNTALLDTLDKQAELISEVLQLDITVAAAERQIRIDQEQIDTMHRAVEMAQQSPYYMAMTRGRNVNFAFVPYANRNAMHIGGPIFDCYLNMLVCRRVGTVKKVFSEEEHAIHPVFRSDMRGFLIQIDLSHPQSAESMTMMLNRKPLLF